jgi:hypothetical protein
MLRLLLNVGSIDILHITGLSLHAQLIRKLLDAILFFLIIFHLDV